MWMDAYIDIYICIKANIYIIAYASIQIYKDGNFQCAGKKIVLKYYRYMDIYMILFDWEYTSPQVHYFSIGRLK